MSSPTKFLRVVTGVDSERKCEHLIRMEGPNEGKKKNGFQWGLGSRHALRTKK